MSCSSEDSAVEKKPAEKTSGENLQEFPSLEVPPYTGTISLNDLFNKLQ